METGHYNIILTFGILLICGYLAGKVANFFKLPKVTGYITAGVLLEPSFLNVLPQSFINDSNIITNFALCIITYAIGGSLQLSRIKGMGKTLVVMTLFEATVTFLFVTLGLFFAMPLLTRFTGLNIQPALYFPLALLAGALASPTDPTPTLAVKEEYKAAGPVTTTILGIGAFDDALGIINFSIAMSVCLTILGGTAGSLSSAIIQPLSEIFFSFVNGIGFGLFLIFAGRKVKDKGVMVVLILGSLFACFGLAQIFNLDELLSTMVLGCVAANSGKDEDKFFVSIRDYFEEFVFVIFFVIAGAHLQLNVFMSSLWIVLIFIIARVVGKFTGAGIGAVISKADPNVKKYVPLGLIPQGGIVVGLALLVKQNPAFSEISTLLLNLVLGTTVFFEFLGPLLTEFALKKSKEVGKAKDR